MKVWLWMLGVLAGLLALLWLVILIFFPDEKIRNMLVAELEDRLGVEVQAGELDLQIFSGLALKDVVIGAPPGFDRPPVRVERLVADYSLGEILQKKFTVTRLLVDRPEIHFEVRQGQSNVAALLSRRRAGKQPEPADADPGEDAGGFTLALGQVEVRDARLGLRLPGFSADLAGLCVTAAGKLGAPKEMFIRTRSRLPVPAEPNLSVDLDETYGGPARLRAALGFDVETRLIGPARLESCGNLELRFPAMDESGSIHRLTVEYEAVAGGEALEAVLKKLEVKLDEKPVLSASGGVTRPDGQVRVLLQVPRLTPPPGLVADLLGRLLPGMQVAGALWLENLRVEGPLEAGMPAASAAIVVEDLDLLGPGARLEKLSGKIQAGFRPQEDKGEYTLQAALAARAGRLAGLRAGGVRVTLDAAGSVRMQAGAPELLSPEIGWALHLASLRGGEIECARVDFQGRLSARDLDLSGGGWRAGKLLGKLDLDLGKLGAGAAEIDRLRVTVDVSGEGLASGRRFPRPLRLSARVRSGALRAGFASLRSADARLGARLSGLAPAALPLTLDAAAEGVVLGGVALSIPGRVKLVLASTLDLRGGALFVERLEAGLGDLIALQASGGFAFREGVGQAVFGIKPFSIERAIAALPADTGKRLPRLKGELELKGETRVVLPEGRFELAEMQHSTEAALLLRGVRGELAGTGLGWEDVSGRLKLTAPGPGFSKATAAANLTAGKVRLKPQVDSSGVSLVLTASRDRGDFSLDGRITAARLHTAGVLARPLRNSQVEFYGRLAGTKELRLKYVKVALPSLGADLSLGGRFVRIPGAEGFGALRLSAKLEAGLHSPTPVLLPGGLAAQGEGSLSLAVESGPGGVLSARGKISFDGLSLKGADFELQGVRGSIPVSQLIATRPAPGLLAGKPGEREKRGKEAAASARSRAYEEALLPMKGRQRSFSIDGVRYQDLRLTSLTGNLELAQGSLNLGSLRLRFLEGDVLAEAAVAFAPPKTRRLSLDAQVSGVDLSGLGALQMAGSSDISGNLRLDLDLGEKLFRAATNLTKIGRSTLQALLVAMDPRESNPGVQNLRRFLNRFKVSPRRVSMDIRHGLLSMEAVMDMGFTARAAARLVEGFEGDTFRLKHLPIGGLLNKYLGF